MTVPVYLQQLKSVRFFVHITYEVLHAEKY